MSLTPSFIITHEAWYYQSLPDRRPEIMIGLYDPDGGCEYEFAVHETSIGHPRLEVFSDAWAALTDERFAPLWAWLAANRSDEKDAHRLADLAAAMRAWGWADNTERPSPDATRALCPACNQELP